MISSFSIGNFNFSGIDWVIVGGKSGVTYGIL
jgi:protein gp37